MSELTGIESAWVHEGTSQNVAALVLENSLKGPVLVNYWSPKAGPCIRLYPVLDKLVHEFEGKLLLVNVNTDEQRPVASEYGVTSVPTLKLFRGGEVVETFHGYHNENELRGLLRMYLGNEVDSGLGEALSLYRDGAVDSAFASLVDTALKDPDDMRVPLTLAKLLAREGRHAEAFELLNALPRDKRGDPAVRNLRAHLAMMLTAREAPGLDVLQTHLAQQPGDAEAAYQLAAVLLVQDDYAGALETLWQVMREEHGFKDGLAVDAVDAIFAMLGPEHPLVQRYGPLSGD